MNLTGRFWPKAAAQQKAFQREKSTLRRLKQRGNLFNKITKVKGLSLLTVAAVIAATNGFSIIGNQIYLIKVRKILTEMGMSQIKLHSVLFLLFFLMLFACSQTAEIKKVSGDSISSSEVDKVVNELMDSANVTGLCLAILNENELVYLKTFGHKNIEKNELLDENSIIL